MTLLNSCSKDPVDLPDSSTDPGEITIDNLKASSTFTWKNTQDAKVTIRTKDNQGNRRSWC